MSYETCPYCKGFGKKSNFEPLDYGWLGVALSIPRPVFGKMADGSNGITGFDDPMKTKCPVCKGRMIINSDTGLPPMSEAKTT